jgi:hypothetical protein
MKRISIFVTAAGLIASILVGCSGEELASSSNEVAAIQSSLIDVAQTSGQLASGTSFRISGSSSDSSSTDNGNHSRHKPGGKHPQSVLLDGLNLLAPTDELLAIVDAESAGDFRGLRISKNGGAIITNYDANGDTVTLPTPASNGPAGCSFSGAQFPKSDSLLATIAKTIIDFGTGVTFTKDTVTITRAGKIIITRSGTTSSMTETISFENYSVNGIGIAGTKVRISTFDKSTGSGSSETTVNDGKITLTNGTVATWTSSKTRLSEITVDNTTGKALLGTITSQVNTQIITADGTVIYSHVTTKPLIENVACNRSHHGPVSGTLQTIYRSHNVIVDYGDGTCENKTVTVTINGETTTKTIGE